MSPRGQYDVALVVTLFFSLGSAGEGHHDHDAIVHEKNEGTDLFINFTFPPDLEPPGSILAVEGENTTVYIGYVCYNCKALSEVELFPFTADEKIVEVVDNDLERLSEQTNFMGGGNITFRGVFIGKSSLYIDVQDERNANENTTFLDIIPVNTKRPAGIINMVFNILTAVLVTANTIGFSCTVDLGVVKGYITKPIGVIIGFVCQYGLMPALAFGLAMAFSLADSLAYGLLAYGASPGGGSSNIWTILFDGDINLSLTMTLCSTLFSLGMNTLWVLTVGGKFINTSHIPFKNILMSLGLLVAACIIGLLVKRFLPKVAKVITKALKVFNLIIVLFFVIFGVIANLYVWKLVTYRIIIPAMLISWSGYIIALFVPFVFRLPWKQMKTIAIETGCQNGGIAILIVRFSLPEPDGELASVAPLMAMMTSSFPLILLYIGVKLQNRFCPDAEKTTEDTRSRDDGTPEDGQVNGGFSLSARPEEPNGDVEHYRTMGIMALERKLSVVSENNHKSGDRTYPPDEPEGARIATEQDVGVDEIYYCEQTTDTVSHLQKIDVNGEIQVATIVDDESIIIKDDIDPAANQSTTNNENTRL